MSLILLAGGNSSRLTIDKAFLKLIDNKTIIENIIDCLKNVFNQIIIVANNEEDYRFLHFKVVPDLVRNKGPLGGIYTGLKTSKEEHNLVLACDMPFFSVDLIKYMLKFNDFDIVVPRFNGYVEPLHAIYSKNILPIIENQLENNELKISDMIKKVKKTRYIEKEEIGRFDKRNICFFNINNKEDLKKARELMENEKRV